MTTWSMPPRGCTIWESSSDTGRRIRRRSHYGITWLIRWNARQRFSIGRAFRVGRSRRCWRRSGVTSLTTGPSTVEGVILRDADILEQLGAVGIMRALAKVGRDNRYPTFTAAVTVLRRNLEVLPGQLQLERGRVLAAPKIRDPRRIPGRGGAGVGARIVLNGPFAREQPLYSFGFAAGIFASNCSISSITRFILRTVRSNGSSVVMSTPASFRSSMGYLNPPDERNVR